MLHGPTSGYCGADLQAICTEAGLCALRRHYPQIYSSSQKLLLNAASITIEGCDFEAALKKMSPASRRLRAPPSKPLSAMVRPLLADALRDSLRALRRLFPHAGQRARTREPGESEPRPLLFLQMYDFILSMAPLVSSDRRGPGRRPTSVPLPQDHWPSTHLQVSPVSSRSEPVGSRLV